MDERDANKMDTIHLDGVKVHLEKMQGIMDWTSPRNIIELRGFLGL